MIAKLVRKGDRASLASDKIAAQSQFCVQLPELPTWAEMSGWLCFRVFRSCEGREEKEKAAAQSLQKLGQWLEHLHSMSIWVECPYQPLGDEIVTAHANAAVLIHCRCFEHLQLRGCCASGSARILEP